MGSVEVSRYRFGAERLGYSQQRILFLKLA